MHTGNLVKTTYAMWYKYLLTKRKGLRARGAAAKADADRWSTWHLYHLSGLTNTDSCRS